MKIVISVGGSVLARALSPEKFKNYAAAIKEISKNEFDFWLRALTDKQTDVEEIKKKLSSGKKCSR